ncbi:MAG: polC [Planctomycetota bacterium]|nr:polC [Planctomycetota bacterium]
MQRLSASTPPSELQPTPGRRFAAIDFETADNGRDSACALAVIVVDNLEIVHRACYLIRPPRRSFLYTYIHGIEWKHVADQPEFADVWAKVSPLLDGVEFLAAHSASFDRSVLYQCCHAAGLSWPELPFQCTVKLARQSWGLKPTTLPDVCRHLGIALRHHEAESDATACAQIVIAARRQGVPLSPFLGKYSGALSRKADATLDIRAF